jgi:acyl carrier protein
MTNDELEKVVQDVFCLVFHLDVVSEDASPATIEEWDSLSHIGLMLELESALGIYISTQEYVEMISYRAIIEILQQRGMGGQ